MINKRNTVFLLFFLVFSFSGLNAFSQDDLAIVGDSVGVNLSTPFHTARTFFLNLQEDHYYPELAAEAFKIRSVNANDAEQTAVKLKQVMDVQGIELELEDIPNVQNYRDTTRKIHQQRFLLSEELPGIFIEKQGRRWLFPKGTVKQVKTLYEAAFPFGTDKLMHKLNNQLRKVGGEKTALILGLYLWQWIGIFLILFSGFALYLFIKHFVGKRLVRFLDQKGYKRIAAEYIMPVMKPLSFLMALIALRVGFRMLDLPFNVYKYILTTIKVAIPLVSTAILYYMANIVAGLLKRFADKTQNTMDDQLVPMVRKGLKALILIIGGIWLLSNLHVDIIPLLTGLSIGGLAFALAAQDTLKNIFGSLMIIVDKPFHIGDWITSGGEIDGMVEEVGFRSTRIRTFRDSVITVPNGKLADMVIDNNGLRQYRRFYTTLSVRYDTPPDVIDLFTKGLRKIVESHPKTWKGFYQVQLNDFGPSSLDIMFYIFFNVPAWEEELAARHEVMMQILRLAKVLGVGFAFPTHTLHMEDFPGRDSLAANYQTSPEELKNRMNQHLSQVNQQFSEN